MSTKPPTPTPTPTDNGDGVLRFCAQQSKVMDTGVPQPIRAFATALINEVNNIIEADLDSAEAAKLISRIHEHVFGTTLK